MLSKSHAWRRSNHSNVAKKEDLEIDRRGTLTEADKNFLSEALPLAWWCNLTDR